MGPIYQNVAPTDSRFRRIMKRCEELQIPVLIHQGTTFCANVSLEIAQPILLQPLALEFPKLRMVIAHMGHPWIDETMVLIRKNRNFFADISALYYRPWQFYNALISAKEYGVLDRLLFGSDYPFTTPQSSMDALRKVNDMAAGTNLPRIPENALEALIQRDSLDLLGL
jgi:predicted TIM-barrel fold metal-dependent hydrolase